MRLWARRLVVVADGRTVLVVVARRLIPLGELAVYQKRSRE
jgi:hypothetical protein